MFAFTVAGVADSDGFMPLSVRRKGREEEEAWSVRVRGDILNLQMPGLDRPVAMKRVPALTVLTPPKPKVVAPVPAVQPEPVPEGASPARVAKKAPAPARKPSEPESSSWTNFAWLGVVGYRVGQALFAVLFLAPLVLAWKRGSRFTLPVTIASLIGVLTVCFGFDGAFWVAYAVSCAVLAVLACVPAKKQAYHLSAVQSRTGVSREEPERFTIRSRTSLLLDKDDVLSYMQLKIGSYGRDKLNEILMSGVRAYIDKSIENLYQEMAETWGEDGVSIEFDPEILVPGVLDMMDERCESLMEFYQDNGYNTQSLMRIIQAVAELKGGKATAAPASFIRKRKYTIKGYND